MSVNTLEMDYNVYQMKMIFSIKKTLLILFSNGRIVNINPRLLPSLDRKRIKKKDISLIFNLQKMFVVKFKLLPCQDRLLLYVFDQKQPGHSLNFDYNKVFMVDPESLVAGKISALAVGNLEDDNVTSDFQGTLLFSVKKKKSKWQVEVNVVEIKKVKEEWSLLSKSQNKKNLELSGICDSEAIPGSICYMGKHRALIVGHRDGKIYVFDVSFLANKENNKDIVLKSQFCTEHLQQKKDFAKDFAEEMLTSWDQRFLICRCKSSRIFIFKYEKFALEMAHEVKIFDPIQHISLSTNGRFLATCGIFFGSVMRVDLSQVDEKSFGQNCVDLISVFREKATAEGKTEAEQYKDNLKKQIKCFKFGSPEAYEDIIEGNRLENKILAGQARNFKGQKLISKAKEELEM